MWNKIAANGAPPQDPGAAPAQDDAVAEMPAAGQVDEETTDQPGEASGGIGQILSERAKSLTPQEQQAFEQGITAPALAVLKKIIPEIGPAIDQLIQKKQGGGGMPGGDPSAAPMPDAAMPPGGNAPPPPQQAKTGLSRF